MPSRRERDARRRGVTLIELMGVLFIVGLLILAASPFLKTMGAQGQSSAVARQVYTDLVRARSEAVRTKLPHLVEFCAQTQASSGATINYVEAGYMVIECASNFSCASYNVCNSIGSDTTMTDPADVKLKVNLTKGMRSAPGQRTFLKALTSVRFGWDPGNPNSSMEDRPSKGTINSTTPVSLPRTFGVDLPGDTLRFYFLPNGTVGDGTASHSPGSGALYLRNGSNKDPNFVRAVDITSAGGVRVYKWDQQMGKWR